jgi:hypothetical protein
MRTGLLIIAQGKDGNERLLITKFGVCGERLFTILVKKGKFDPKSNGLK